MQFLNSTTLEAVVGQTVTLVVVTKTKTTPRIAAKAFLKDGRLFIGCIPALPEKYIVAIPEDAIISSADRPDKNWKYGIFINGD